MKKKLPIFLLFLCLSAGTGAQLPRISVGTDLGFQRNFRPEQRFWAFGHTIQLHIHITPVDGFYTWFAYYTNGKFSNAVTATAKNGTVSPQEMDYLSHSKMRLKQFSLGWKRYLKGNFETEKSWNLYGYAGFGLIMGSVVNTHSVPIDTADYTLPVLSGKAHFKRLTVDLGLGVEIPLRGDFYFYSEGRVWIPTTDYPSGYILKNDNAPFAAMISGGLRILF